MAVALLIAGPALADEDAVLTDDIGFIGALIDHLAATGVADPAKVD